MKTIVTPWRDRVLVLDGEGELPPMSVFSPSELEAAEAFRLPSRRLQWLWSRFAAKDLAVQKGLASRASRVTVERPRILVDGEDSHWRVSLSHSGPYAGAAIAAAPVGVDVQTVRDLSGRAAHLFLRDDESDAMLRCALPAAIIHFWSAKEAAWKREEGRYLTLKELPLQLLSEQVSGLAFDRCETLAIGELVVALAA